MKLSRRLETIAAMVPSCGCVADVGTDHGFVPIRLLELLKAERAIAMDVRLSLIHILIAGIEKPTAGKIYFDGTDITEKNINFSYNSK